MVLNKQCSTRATHQRDIQLLICTSDHPPHQCTPHINGAENSPSSPRAEPDSTRVIGWTFCAPTVILVISSVKLIHAHILSVHMRQLQKMISVLCLVILQRQLHHPPPFIRYLTTPYTQRLTSLKPT